MQANDPDSFPNWLTPSVFNGFPPVLSNPFPLQLPLLPIPFHPVVPEAAGPLIPFAPNLNQPHMQAMPQWNLTPTVVGQKRRRIESTIQVEEEFGYQGTTEWKEEKKPLNRTIGELKVWKSIHEQKCQRLETKCQQLNGYVATLVVRREMQPIEERQKQTKEDSVIKGMKEDKERLEKHMRQLKLGLKEQEKHLKLKIEESEFAKWISEQRSKRLETEIQQLKSDVAKLTKLDVLQIDRVQQTEEDLVIQGLKEDKERLKNEVLQLKSDLAKLTKLEKLSIDQMQQTEEDTEIEELRKNQERLEQQVTQLQVANQVAHEAKIQIETNFQSERKQSEMKEEIRIIKEENEAEKLISEKRIKALKEAKKKLQAQGISSKLRFKKKLEELEEKLKAANSRQQLQAMSQGSLETNELNVKIQKITLEESSQTDRNDLESEFKQLQKKLSDTGNQFCQHLSSKDEQIVAVNSQLAKTQQQLDDIKTALDKEGVQ